MIGARIENLIQQRGIKQRWLAEQIGVSESRMSAMLTGRSGIRADELFRICEALGVSSDEFNPEATEGK